MSAKLLGSVSPDADGLTVAASVEGGAVLAGPAAIPAPRPDDAHGRILGKTALTIATTVVQLVFKDAAGLLLPRTAKEQSEVGNVVDRKELKPGDLVFFNTMRRAFSHVGIYLGDNHFLHAPRAGAEVRVENMENSYWLQRYNGARRILEGN